MNNGERTDSRDESGQHPTGDVLSDIPSEAGPTAVPDRKVRVLCPYCGRGTLLAARCEQCKGLLDPLSRQATQNSMGPWFIHDPANPYRPGCSYEVIREMIRRGKVTAETVLRGPTTRQYWMLAARTPSVSNLLGRCHNCQKEVQPDAIACPSCNADFSPELDRQFLGLGPVYLLPGQASPEEIARAAAQQNAHHDRAHHAPAVAHPRPAAAPHVPHAAHAAATHTAPHGQPQRAAPATITASPAAAATPPRPAARPRHVDESTGEYRALLERMERADRDLSNTRMLLALAGVAVIILVGAVLYFSGILTSASTPRGPAPLIPNNNTLPHTAPATNTQPSSPQPALQPAPRPSPAEAGLTPEELPTDLNMPPDPDAAPGNTQDPGLSPPPEPRPNPNIRPGDQLSGPGDAPTQPKATDPKTPDPNATDRTPPPADPKHPAQIKPDPAARHSQWSLLRGLP
ncbi:MAG TPA: hypothetical protein VK176_03310 [Phycisphaerales bacterium]|nr:hypothetical protein [Phycisphaerales bacterium]